MTTAALMPTEEWIAYWLDLYVDDWRTTPGDGEYILVDSMDERGPWFVETTGVTGELVIDGEQMFSEVWR